MTPLGGLSFFVNVSVLLMGSVSKLLVRRYPILNRYIFVFRMSTLHIFNRAVVSVFSYSIVLFIFIFVSSIALISLYLEIRTRI